MSLTHLTDRNIVNELFDFCNKHFDKFECKGPGFDKWWRGKSWSPYTESCFIKLGEKLLSHGKIDKIGHSVIGNSNSYVEQFLKDIGQPCGVPLDDQNIDVSLHNSDKIILAFEHEESKGKDFPGTNVESNLKHISEEIDKLNRIEAEFKIIATRPYLRRFVGRKDTYPDVIEIYKQEIESNLSKVKVNSTEKWIVILIGPNNSLKPTEKTDILFYNYIWNGSELSIISNKSFKVGMNANNEVKKI